MGLTRRLLFGPRLCQVSSGCISEHWLTSPPSRRSYFGVVKKVLLGRCAAPAPAIGAVVALGGTAAVAMETTTSDPAVRRLADCPSRGDVFGGGRALAASDAGWRYMIAADPVIDVQGRRYRRSRRNTPLVEVVQLGSVDTTIGPLPGVRELKRLARKRCAKAPPSSLDGMWAFAYHETLSVISRTAAGEHGRCERRRRSPLPLGG
jgi:hypothetical protein